MGLRQSLGSGLLRVKWAGGLGGLVGEAGPVAASDVKARLADDVVLAVIRQT